MLVVYLAMIDHEDCDLFEKIYNEYEHRLFGFSMLKLHDKMLAEDAVSETFFTLAKNFEKVNNLEMSEIIAFTVIINRNICYDILKREKKHRDHVISDEFIEEKEDESFEDNLDKFIIKEAVSKLPDIYRDVIVLRYYYGMSNNGIAKIFGLTESGIRARIKRAKKLLREELET